MDEEIETFYPKLRRQKVIRRKRRWVTGPLFPRYFFAKFDWQTSGRLVRYSRSVINVVNFGGKPAIVDEPIIKMLRDHCEIDTVTLPPPTFRPGDMVQIQEGPLRGLQGIFERDMNDSERVVVLLETIAGGTRVQVPKAQLEKV